MSIIGGNLYGSSPQDKSDLRALNRHREIIDFQAKWNRITLLVASASVLVSATSLVVAVFK